MGSMHERLQRSVRGRRLRTSRTITLLTALGARICPLLADSVEKLGGSSEGTIRTGKLSNEKAPTLA